jgi:hypothetical protein
MGYKILGIIVWRGTVWYLRRRFPLPSRKVAIAGGVGLLAAAGAAAFSVRRRANGASAD